MIEYSEIIYVSQSNGDDNNDGTRDNPVKTINKAKQLVSVDNTLIQINDGIYNIEKFPDLSHENYMISYLGNGIKTVLNITNCESMYSFKNKVNFMRMIIRPDDKLSGDTRAVSYSTDIFEVQFYNILFLRSVNNKYPNSWFFIFHNNQHGDFNKKFYNCIFDIDVPVSIQQSTYVNTCTTHNTFSGGYGEIINNSYTNAILDDEYNVINEELIDKGIGIYSGEYSWKNYRYLLKDKNGTFSYSDNDKIYLDSITVDKLKDRGLATLDDILKYHKQFDGESIIRYVY